MVGHWVHRVNISLYILLPLHVFAHVRPPIKSRTNRWQLAWVVWLREHRKANSMVLPVPNNLLSPYMRHIVWAHHPFVMLKDREHLSRARALTRKLQRALDKFEPALGLAKPKAQSAACNLGPAFEFERVRSSTAPSVEIMPTGNPNDKTDLEYSKSGRST